MDVGCHFFEHVTDLNNSFKSFLILFPSPYQFVYLLSVLFNDNFRIVSKRYDAASQCWYCMMALISCRKSERFLEWDYRHCGESRTQLAPLSHLFSFSRSTYLLNFMVLGLQNSYHPSYYIRTGKHEISLDASLRFWSPVISVAAEQPLVAI